MKKEKLVLEPTAEQKIVENFVVFLKTCFLIH